MIHWKDIIDLPDPTYFFKKIKELKLKKLIRTMVDYL